MIPATRRRRTNHSPVCSFSWRHISQQMTRFVALLMAAMRELHAAWRSIYVYVCVRIYMCILFPPYLHEHINLYMYTYIYIDLSAKSAFSVQALHVAPIDFSSAKKPTRGNKGFRWMYDCMRACMHVCIMVCMHVHDVDVQASIDSRTANLLAALLTTSSAGRPAPPTS